MKPNRSQQGRSQHTLERRRPREPGQSVCSHSNCDAWFTTPRVEGTRRELKLEQAGEVIAAAKAEGRAHGREIGAYAAAVVVCRPTHEEAVAYHHYATYENANWAAIDNTLRMKGLDKLPPDEVEYHRRALANGRGGLDSRRYARAEDRRNAWPGSALPALPASASRL